MLYVCIPVHNEATTIGVLLWRIRTVLQEYTREYEVVVYDDGSTDATAEVLEPYRRVLPLTVLRAQRRRGVAFAVDALCRHVVAHTRYPRRDAVVLMQGDFTDRPEDLPELSKRFEGGADLVIGRRPASLDQPHQERRLRQLAPWVLRPFVRVAEVEDLLTAFRLVRVSVLRDLARARGDALVAEGEGWAATVDFALAVAPYARRVDVVDLPGRYDLRPRESRLDWWRELRGLAGYAWRARGRRVAAGERIGDGGAERAPDRRQPDRAPERGDVAVIGSVSTLAGGTDGARVAERGEGERAGRASRDKRRPERQERVERPARVERPERPKRAPEAVEGEAPRKRSKPRRAEQPAGAAPASAEEAEVAAGSSAQAPLVERPPRAARAPGRTERLSRETSEEATDAVGGVAAREDGSENVDGIMPSTAAVGDPAGEGAGGDERTEAGVRRKARRRRRRSRGGSGGSESGANAESAAEATGDASVEAGSPSDAGDESAAGGQDDDGSPVDGALGEGAPRKRSRRRRRGRGRGERADGAAGTESGADDGGGGTDAPDGVGERTMGMGVAAPRASAPDPTAD